MMNDEEVKTLLADVLEQQRVINEKLTIAQTAQARKDGWDRLGAISPIISAVIIACVGAYFTFSFNQQQLKVQEIQTIERFIPHLAGSEQSKRAAILAISSLGDTKVAAKVASIFASEGTVSALHSMAATTTDQGNKEAVITSLTKALESISERYQEQNKTDQAIAASTEALSIKEKTFGAESPSILRNLDRLAEMYRARGDNAMVEDLLKRTLSIQQKMYGPNSEQAQSTSRQLAQLAKPNTAVDPKLTAVKSGTTPATVEGQAKPATAGALTEEAGPTNEAKESQPEPVSTESADTVKAPLHVRLVEKRKVADLNTTTQTESQ